MRVLLISANMAMIPDPVFPIGLGKESRVNVRLLQRLREKKIKGRLWRVFH